MNIEIVKGRKDWFNWLKRLLENNFIFTSVVIVFFGILGIIIHIYEKGIIEYLNKGNSLKSDGLIVTIELFSFIIVICWRE